MKSVSTQIGPSAILLADRTNGRV